MGNTNSTKPKTPSGCGSKALNMLQVRPNLYNNNDGQLSVKFSRNDLADSVSALSMGTALKPMNGGGRHYSDNHLHPNAPQHQTYLKYLSTKTMDMNGGGGISTLSSGIINNLSSESEGDWNQIKSMLIRGQNGGCGCDAGRVLQDGGNNNLSASSFDLSFSNSQSTMSAESAPNMYGGSHKFDNNLYSATSPMNNSAQFGGSNNLYSATSPMNMSHSDLAQYGGKWDSAKNTSSTSMQNINYEMLLGGKKTHKDSSSSSSQSSTSLSDIDASSSSSTSTTMSGSSPEGVIKRALSKNAMSETTRELKRMEASEQKKEKASDSSSSSSSSSDSSDSSKSTNSSSSSSASSSSASSEGRDAFAKITRYDNIVLTSEGSANNNNVINVKQFYSSDSGELFSASSNFLRNNINKNRLR
jgi:hypothetical protein